MTDLSPGQVRVLALMAEGLSNDAIADVLGISTRAVEKHCRVVFAKLDLPITNMRVSRRVMAVLWYREHHLGEQGPQGHGAAEQAGV